MQRDRHKIWLCLPVGIAVFPGRYAGKPFEHGNKVIVVREDAGGGDLTDFPFRMLGEKRFRLFYAQDPDMFGDTAAVILAGNFVEIGFSDLETAAQVSDAYFFGKVRADILVNLCRQFFALYDCHSLQTKTGGAFFPDVFPAGFIIGRIGKYMAKKQIANHDIAQSRPVPGRRSVHGRRRRRR